MGVDLLGQKFKWRCRDLVGRGWHFYMLGHRLILRKSSQVNTLPKAKSKTRSKQNKDMHKFRSVYSERGVLLSV